MSRPARTVLAVLFVIACIGLRLAWLPFDPPGWLSWSSGVYTDEGFYTLDARHRVLFGTLAPGNFHDSYTAPLLSWIQTGWFRLCGVGLIQARLLDVLFALLTIGLFWDTLRRRSVNIDTKHPTPLLGKGAERPGASISTAATVMLGLSPVYLFYNDLALQETPALFWIVLALWLIAIPSRPGSIGHVPPGLGARGPEPTANTPALVLSALAGACVIAAFATKSLSMIAAPAIVAAVWSPLLSKERVRVRLAFVTGLAIAGAVFLAVTLPHHADIARMSKYYAQHQILPHTALSMWLNIKRAFVGGERGVFPYLLATMPVSMILATVAVRRSRPVPIDPVPVIWLACSLAFCMFSRYAPSRYYVLFLPALCWLAAIGWCGLPQRARQAILIAFVLGNLMEYSVCSRNRTSTAISVGSTLMSFDPGQGMLGEFAPEICLGTKMRSMPLQPGLSNDDRPIETLNPDYITVCRSPFWRGWWQARYPKLIAGDHLVRTVRLGGHGQYIVDIYRVH